MVVVVGFVGVGVVFGVFVGIGGRVGVVLFFFSWFRWLFRFRYWFWVDCLSWVLLCCNCLIEVCRLVICCCS